MPFPTHDTTSAPEASRPILEKSQAAFGFLPNLLGGMAESPALLDGYVKLSGAFEKSSLSTAEKQTILLTVSRENECHYCMAAHSAIALMQGVDEGAVNALRDDDAIADPRLEALRVFTAKLVKQRGWVSEEDQGALLAAGFSRAQILDVVVGVGVKTLSNYFNHIADTPLDEAFAPHRWTPLRD